MKEKTEIYIYSRLNTTHEIELYVDLSDENLLGSLKNGIERIIRKFKNGQLLVSVCLNVPQGNIHFEFIY